MMTSNDLTGSSRVAAEAIRQLREGAIDAVGCGNPDANPAQRSGKVIFPGAFHPLHAGHRLMARVAEEMCGAPVEFEISVLNVDKPPLDDEDIVARLGQFPADQTVWLTRAATFIKKCRLFPSSHFVVGADTVVRIGDARYYRGNSSTLRAAIGELAQHGCRFLVFGRSTGQGFQTLRNLSLPPELQRLCEEVPEQRFRFDISSTELRSAAATQKRIPRATND